MHEFDEAPDRSQSGCLKIEELYEVFGRNDLLPLWIADMDFQTPRFIIEALTTRLKHPVFGYTAIPNDYYSTIVEWVYSIHGWNVNPNHIRYIPGIVKGIGMIIDCFLTHGDKIIIQTPVYHPFRLVPQKKGYELIYNPLIPVYEDGIGKMENMCTIDRNRKLTGYMMDLDNLEKIIDENTKLLILCNPHNPAGICWDKNSLKRLAEITTRHNIIVISDEIHAEMALYGNKHIPYASVSKQAASNAITLMSPSKTFNIAGIVSSYAIVENINLRNKFFNYLEAGELCMPDIFAPIATIAAYKNGTEWRQEMLNYVQKNIDYVDNWLKINIPQIRCIKPEASFLVWLDCRQLNMTQSQLNNLFVNKAHLALNDGTMFSSNNQNGTTGNEGKGFMRMNVGCPQKTLIEALRRLSESLH